MDAGSASQGDEEASENGHGQDDFFIGHHLPFTIDNDDEQILTSTMRRKSS